MDREKLRRLLEQLHSELVTTQPVDADARAQLRRLQREISDALARETPPASLRERLEDGVAEFEASHPTVARRLAEVIDTLALYGL
jgi:Domain of unknown function (DUF4404)